MTTKYRQAYLDAIKPAKKRHKYGAVATVLDGEKFASKGEAVRHAELLLAQRGGAIKDLKRQPSFPLIVRGREIATYVGDWEYREAIRVRRDGKLETGWLLVVEDFKGVQTPVFKLKWALAQALYSMYTFRLSGKA